MNDGSWAYSWEHGRQLASMTNGTTTIDYEYNANGIRTKKTVTTASNHTHVFQSNVVAPTCTENGFTRHSCSCGYIYQDSPVAATGHTFTSRVIDATCTENGYTLKECACGYSYQEGSNGHNFTTLVVEPTETVNGFTRHTCACGYSYESDPVVSLCTDEGAELPATADIKVYDYVYNGSSLTQLVITTTAYGESPVVETLYFGNGTVTYNGTVYYYVTNLQGDIVAILDTTGAAVVTYSYDAWGNILEISGSGKDTLGVANPLTYRGYVYDAESALYYLQSRYYNSEVGRFLNADAFASTGQGFIGCNMFAYCNNNPVLFSDPSGLYWRMAYARISLGNSDKTRPCTLADYINSIAPPPKKTLDELLQHTHSTGITIGSSMGGLTMGKNYTISHDNSGDFALQESDSYGTSMSLGAGGSIGVLHTITNASNVMELNGEASNAGFTICLLVGISVDITWFKTGDGSTKWGVTLAAVLGAEAEMHISNSGTYTTKSGRFFELIR